MSTIELDELGPPLELPLTAEEGRALAFSGVVSAVPSPYRPGIWLVGAAGKVGAARIGSVEVFIRPKVEIARLLFLLGYAEHGGAWQQDTVRVASAADLIPVIAQALWRQTERAIHQGLLPGYVVVEESSQVLRGRLRESAQLHAHHGLPLPLEIRHDEFTIDIPENQILRTACERMLSVPRVDSESQRMLRRLLRDFGDVTVIPRGSPVPLWEPTRLNARYHAALRIASLVLDATSVEHETGNVAVNGFLLDMPLLFEQFVTVALREAITARFGGRVEGQVRYYLDQAGQVPLRPEHRLEGRRHHGRGHRCQVQGRETRRLPERRPLPAPRLLHDSRPACRAPGLRAGERLTRAARRPSVRRRDHLPRHRPQPAAGTADRGDEQPRRSRHRYGDHLLSVSRVSSASSLTETRRPAFHR